MIIKKNASILQRELDKLRRKHAILSSKYKSLNRTLTYKVSPKGALSIYGVGRYPVTLYKGQWEKLLKNSDEIIRFIEKNEACFSRKTIEVRGSGDDETESEKL